MPRMGQGAAAPQKPKDMKKSLGKLFRYLKAFAPLIFVSIALMIFEVMIAVALYQNYKWDQEIKRKRQAEYRRQQYYINQAKYYDLKVVDNPRARGR